jgi:formate hydrogenlyase subunit 3/multisubunit Na+/H+ antiporter MnhD subunit
MILFFAYAAVLFCFLSGLFALLMPFRHSLIKRFCSSATEQLGEENRQESSADTVVKLRIQQITFVLLGIAGLFAVSAGLGSLMGQLVITDTLPLGLPWIQWHIRFDSLSGFFYLIIGISVIACSLYGPGYVRSYDEEKDSFAILGLFTGLFVAGMLMVLLADDAFMFMISWELMSVTSYFLVAFQHEQSVNRRAAFLYLVMAQVGAIAIILGFGVLASFSENYSFTFDALRAANLSPEWESVAFILALLGFGMKAGLVPVHVWLPEAHPVAPSHISALMSGVMLKVALYGLIRFTFELLGNVHTEWGIALLILGATSALGGILYAMMQTNLKRMLAYSSVENIGIIFMVLGISMIFKAEGHPHVAALGFIAALFHAFNHSLFKSLLFLGAGVIQHQVHELNMEVMGGLIKRMPHTSKLMLVACMSISSLPLFNGFVSEWLAFQTALQVDLLDTSILRSLIPVSAAALALTAALAAACFVKVYGVIFLGKARSRHSEKARETADKGMLSGLTLLAGLCFIFGIFPGAMIQLLNHVSTEVLGPSPLNVITTGWVWLAPISAEKASYSAPYVLVGASIAGLISFKYLRRNPAMVLRKAETWDCGFGGLTPRMQYGGISFSMPFQRIFEKTWVIDEKIEKVQAGAKSLQVTDIHYKLTVEDHCWGKIYMPIERMVNRLAQLVGRIQTGNIRVYLSYSFATLILLLWVIS